MELWGNKDGDLLSHRHLPTLSTPRLSPIHQAKYYQMFGHCGIIERMNITLWFLLTTGMISGISLFWLKDQPYYRETKDKNDWTVKAYVMALFLFSWITFFLVLVKNS